MTNPMSPRDPDAILAAWLEEGPTQLPETTRRAIGVGLRSTRQTRRVLDVPWRPTIMNPFVRLAVVAAAIVIVAGGALYLLPRENQTVGGPSAAPSPSVVAPSASPSAQASASPSPPLAWETYEAARFGYKMEVPVGWTQSNAIDDLPDHLPGEEVQYAARWDEPVNRSPYLIVAIIDAAPEADGAWLERTVARLIADCGAEDPVTVSVAGTTGERRRATCMGGLATEIVFFRQGVGSIDRIFMIESSAAPADAALASEILDHVLASFTFGSVS
jgi:hypothetical protein